MNQGFTVPSVIHLYHGADPLQVNGDNLTAFLREYFPRSIINVREDFFRYWFQRCEKNKKKAMIIARRLAQAKVRQPQKRQLNFDPLIGEVSFEHKFLTAGSGKPAGLLYDGYE